MSPTSKFVFVFLLAVSLLSSCKPQQANPIPESQPATPEASIPSTENPEAITFTGKIIPMDRPAPDTAYDYKLVLDKPFTDVIEDGSGEAQHQDITLSGYSTETATTLQQALQENRKVEVTGVMEWGYAEQRVFHVLEIK